MDKKIETLVDSVVEKFTLSSVDIRGLLVCDKNGLVLTSKNVSISPGPIACLAELAKSLSGRRATICLESTEDQVIIEQADKAVVAVYVRNAS